MSWMKRQGSGATPRPEQQAFTSPQPYGNQQNMFPAYQGPPPGHQQQTWQMPQQQQQYNQQYGQVYQQQPFVNNASQYFQQPQQQYNQNYVNQNFDNVQPAISQPTYQQNYNHNQKPQQHNFTQNEGNVDGWEDNWGWGWDDASKQYQKSVNQPAAPQPATQPQLYNNSNVIEESFAPTNSWNWSMEDKKELEVPRSVQTYQHNQEEPLHVENVVNENNIFNESLQGNGNNVMEQENPEKVKNLSDKEAVKEQLPNLALGKRSNLENLTPQWSIESQMSQDSSDGPHTQSEGTYRSENQSRNSSKSSPGPNTDTTHFNYSQSGLNEMNLSNSEWSKQTNDGSNRTSSVQSNNRSESYDELANSVKEMNIGNHEHIPVGGQQSSHNIQNIQENMELVRAPEPSVSPISSLPNQLTPQAMPPPPPVTSQHVQNSHSPVTSQGNAVPTQSLPPINIPTSAHGNAANLPPPPTSMPLLPPSNFSTSSTQNPFKSGAPFSHKNIAKAPGNSQSQTFPPQLPGANLTSPVVNKVVQQDRLLGSFGANLETTPDNSERPDQPQVTSYRSMPIPPQVPDNLEIAPQNDRNEYLQTAHLSSGDYGENTDFSRNIPPPGLRRMGVGQQEGEYNQSLNISGDEPPPGLARMVPGQQTETSNSYNQATDDYMDRQIDGQPTDGSGRPYRQADGQQIADNYTPSVATRGGDRRPVGLDRMVPGEPSNDEYPQYPNSNFASANEQRVVTGVDHDYPVSTDTSRNDIREQNVDGSDYTEPPPRNSSRSVIGAREASNATSPDFSLSVDDQQREITMEGENLQDLSVITYDVSNANVVEVAKDRSHDAADATEYPNNSRRQSLSRVTSGEDSERDRAFKASPRKDRDKQKSRERDRERDKDRGRYSRGDRKYESERRSARDDRRDRRERDASPELARQSRHRRSTRSHRYETEDTDYNSDREKDRRHYREGSYTSSKPPRGVDKDRRHDDRERRRFNTIERERRYEEERGRRSDRHRERDRDRDRDRDRNPDRFDRRYRDIDPRKFSSLRGDREDDDRRKGETYSSGSRAGSREATATDEDGEEPRRRAPRDDRRRHRHHHYYEGYGAPAAAAAEAQRRQYEYYERLRLADPAAYMRVYKQLLHPGLYAANLYDGYGALGYEARAEERGSVHSGRSSAAGLKPADTWCGRARAASLRTDASDRELTTDMSLNLHLEESTVRSERMTPFKYSTAHVKGVVCASSLLVVPAGYPVDARAAPLRLLPLRALLPAPALARAPGPLLKGVTHKKSVVEYCAAQARGAAAAGAGGDGAGWALLWDLLALLLRQNGVVMGSDIAELLMKNTKEFEYKPPPTKSTDLRRDSAASSDVEGEPAAPAAALVPKEEEVKKPAVSEQEALERFREYLIYGNRQEALEWAMSCGLWGHALQLAAAAGRRERAAACARFVAALAPADPLHSLYAALALRAPPAATCVADERWGDWRPHAAIILSNASSKPEQDRRTLTQLGDSLNARGLLYSAQFCYLSAGVPFAPHPLAPHRAPPAPAPGAAPAPAPAPAGAAPPRLSLLLADPRAESLAHFATDHAIFATEIYEYAMSLSQDFVLDELVVYKLVAAARLADAGCGERALRYAEAAARALTAAPRRHAPSLARALAALADRLKYFDPALQEEGAAGAEGAEGEGEVEGEGSADASPRHQQWLRDVHAVALQLSAEASQQNTPQHHTEPGAGWADQTLQQTEQVPQYSEPVEDTTDYSHYYQQQNHHQQQQQQFHEQHQQLQHQYLQQQQLQQVPEHAPEQQYDQQYGYEEHTQSYADPYWQNDTHYGYDSAAGAEEAPTITMPGARAAPALFADDDDRPASADQPDRDADTPKTNGKKAEAKGSEGGKDKKSGWLGGILTKLSLRAPNQMILPDDTNPTIVWDEEHKRWRDLAAAAAAPAPPPPPPARSTSTPLQSPGAPPAAPGANIFKMQKSRHIKKSYVDVLNPGGGAPAPAPAPLAPPAPAPAPAPGGYFVPAPHHDQLSPPPVHVSIPPSPAASPRAAPAPAPATLPPEGGIYDPTQVAAADDFRSGI